MSLRSKFKHSKVFILWFLNTDKLVKKKIVCASYFQPTCPYLEILRRTLTRIWTLHKDVQIKLILLTLNFSLLKTSVLSSKWLTEEKIRWNCLASLSVTDPRFIPDHHFTASSSTTTEVPWNGRASKKSRTPWCPGKKDHNSYLQVDLGAVRNVTAIGTGMLAKFKARYAKRIKIYSSRRGNIWKNDGKVRG